MPEFAWTEPLSLEDLVKSSRDRSYERRQSPKLSAWKGYLAALVLLAGLMATSFTSAPTSNHLNRLNRDLDYAPKLTVPGELSLKTPALNIPHHHPSLKNYVPKLRASKPQVPKVPFGALIYKMAVSHDLDPLLFAALVRQESNFNPQARSYVGASGLTQLMPATAQGLGVRNAHDPEDNLHGGAVYLRDQIKRFSSIPLGLAAYNAGPGAVIRYGGIPPYSETQKYVKNILSFYQEFKNQG